MSKLSRFLSLSRFPSSLESPEMLEFVPELPRLPGRFRFRPVLKSDCLVRFEQSWFFNVIYFPFAVATVLTFSILANLVTTNPGLTFFVSLVGFPVVLTEYSRRDRTLLWLVTISFDYLFLSGSYLVGCIMVIVVSVDEEDWEQVLLQLFYATFMITYLFNMDANPTWSPRKRLFVLVTTFLGLSIFLVSLTLSADDGNEPTSVRNLRVRNFCLRGRCFNYLQVYISLAVNSPIFVFKMLWQTYRGNISIPCDLKAVNLVQEQEQEQGLSFSEAHENENENKSEEMKE